MTLVPLTVAALCPRLLDLPHVLFPNGHAVEDECLVEADAGAIGVSAHVASDENGTRYRQERVPIPFR